MDIDNTKTPVGDTRTILGMSNYLSIQKIKELINKGYDLSQRLTVDEIYSLDLGDAYYKKSTEYEVEYFSILKEGLIELNNGKKMSIVNRKIIGGEDIAFNANVDYYMELTSNETDIGIKLTGRDSLPEEIYLFAHKSKEMVHRPCEIEINELAHRISIPRGIGFCEKYPTDKSGQILTDKMIQILGTSKEKNGEKNSIESYKKENNYSVEM